MRQVYGPVMQSEYWPAVIKDNFDIIGMLSYGKENFIAMSHTKSELIRGNVGTGLKIDVNKKHTYWLE